MNKLIIILPVAVILSGCSLLPSSKITGTNEQKAEKLGQIMSRGGQADCKVTNLADNTTQQMTISGKKMKITGANFGDGKMGTLINDTEYSYMWDDASKTGIKTRLAVETPTPSVTGTRPEVTPTSQTTEYEDETKYNVDCSTRVIQDSEFIPPADVKFTDLEQMMKAIPSMPPIPSMPEGSY